MAGVNIASCNTKISVIAPMLHNVGANYPDNYSYQQKEEIGDSCGNSPVLITKGFDWTWGMEMIIILLCYIIHFSNLSRLLCC